MHDGSISWLVTGTKRKGKEWFGQNQDNVDEWGVMSIRGLLFQ
jgi:hypothetical protein